MRAVWKPLFANTEEMLLAKDEWLTVTSVRQGVYAWEVALGAFGELGHLRCSGTVKTKTEAKQQAEHMYRVLKKEKTT